MAIEWATIIPALAGLGGGAAGTVALVPRLARGDLVSRRELNKADTDHKNELARMQAANDRAIVDLKERYAAELKRCDSEADRLEQTARNLQLELKAQYAINSELAEKVIAGLATIDRMRGLAEIERRGGGI